jgi:hypothetical protein
LGGGGFAGDVGDDRAVSGQLTGSVGEFAEGRQIDMEMYTTNIFFCLPAKFCTLPGMRLRLGRKAHAS